MYCIVINISLYFCYDLIIIPFSSFDYISHGTIYIYTCVRGGIKKWRLGGRTGRWHHSYAGLQPLALEVTNVQLHHVVEGTNIVTLILADAVYHRFAGHANGAHNGVDRGLVDKGVRPQVMLRDVQDLLDKGLGDGVGGALHGPGVGDDGINRHSFFWFDDEEA